jgi:hypothetical protein
MAKQVLRLNGTSISHVYYCTIEGRNIYLTLEANELMLHCTEEIISSYYSGEDYPSINDYEDEIDSLKADITALLTGETPINVMKLRIARSNGLIKDEDILEING